ncbi:hypothetical protein SO802_006975 [Lithocarpus litseifolius]|uniref:Uncharacterized protein n=1 Tax=Lithocarpus litseifolius TaxID=425828 RepID=A0AAW2DPY6_9ROSI
MSHPVHDANESSPDGDLTREEFYKNHQILHKESFMLNQQSMKIFTQSWRPNFTLQLKGLVTMLHGYNSESSWLFELTAVAIAKAGFLVCAIDLQAMAIQMAYLVTSPTLSPLSARFVYESAASEDKILKIFPSMWHQLIGEPKENVELVYGFISSWLGDRANKGKSSANCF